MAVRPRVTWVKCVPLSGAGPDRGATPGVEEWTVKYRRGEVE